MAARLAVYASIPVAPDHLRNHAQEELREDSHADVFPTVAAWQYIVPP